MHKCRCCTDPLWWSSSALIYDQEQWKVTKNEMADTRGGNESRHPYLQRQGEELRHSGGAHSRAAAPSHQTEPVRVVHAARYNAFWVLPQWGVSGMYNSGDPDARGHNEEITCLAWLLNTSVFPEEKLKKMAGDWKIRADNWCPHDLFL